MKLAIELTKPFSDAVGTRELELDFNGSTVEQLLKVLVDKYPKLKDEFYTETGEITDYIIVFVNDKPISALEELDTEVRDGDKILFFFPISGG